MNTSRPHLESFYREAVLAGVALHLRYRFGNLGNSSGWSPIEEPHGESLSRDILSEIESHYDYWMGRREMADALYAVARAIETPEDGDRIAFLLHGSLSSKDPRPDRSDGNDRIFVAINSTRGVAAEAAFSLATRWAEAGRKLPALLAQALMRVTADPHISVRALALRLLPVVLHHQRELGWSLLERALFSSRKRAWKESYGCFYYNYHRYFNRIRTYLDEIRADGSDEALKVWGRITTLCCLSDHIEFESHLAEMAAMKSDAAWSGAASVFSANIASTKHRFLCTKGLLDALDFAADKAEIIRKIDRVFYENPGLAVDLRLLRDFLVVSTTLDDQKRNRNVRAIGEWLAPIGNSDPDFALEAAEIVLEHLSLVDLWNGEPFTKLLTALFREAEERELSDNGQFLARVVGVQDALLRRGVHKLEDWLKDAERP